MGALGGIVKGIRCLIPKPKDDHARSLPVGRDDELQGKVQREFGLLIEQHQGHFSSNGRLPIMDFAWVSFDVGNFRVRAARDRGSINISLAPLSAVRHWCSLAETLLAVQQDSSLPKTAPSSSIWGAGTRLATEFAKLNEAFSEAQFPATRELIQANREAERKTYIEEWNRKPHMYRATRS